ncbi:SseB family protein [Leucobacter sp. W1478]|uniref:SseB family protein n=1 Tax=Leucobacter sp. W1478 TaxID=3439065 RepID=UPI003F3B10F7
MAIKRLPSTGDAPRSTGVPASLVPGGESDSAGFPWQGRTFDHHGSAFEGDDGETPVPFSLAVDALRSAATARDLRALADASAHALLQLSGSRVLIPLLAEAGEIGVTPDGRTVEKTQELSIVTVAGPDGRRVMPVFSSVRAMGAWNPTARPIPVPGPQVALAAAQEETDLIIVDPGTVEREFGVRRTALEALALGQHLVPAWADPVVRESFEISVADDLRVRALEIRPGDPECRLLAPEVEVVLHLAPGLDREALDELIDRAQRRWASSAVIAARVDSLRVLPRAHA